MRHQLPASEEVTAERTAVAVIGRLRRLGFTAEHILDVDGELDALYLSRSWRGVREVVLVYSATEALGYRTTAVFDPDRPFHLEEDTVLWRHGPDTPEGVAAGLLASPAPSVSSAS